MSKNLNKVISTRCWIFVIFFSIFQIHMYGKTVLVSNSIEIDNILQQRITVTGKVVEPSGEPIIGAKRE